MQGATEVRVELGAGAEGIAAGAWDALACAVRRRAGTPEAVRLHRPVAVAPSERFDKPGARLALALEALRREAGPEILCDVTRLHGSDA